jgi:two-component system, cell cycle sensor histidine kinase and response regulator CckA
MLAMLNAAQSSLLDDTSGDLDSQAHIGFETARLRLAEIRIEGSDARFSACRVACEQSARTLGVERVSVWMLDSERESINCIIQYLLSNNTFSEGATILRDTALDYFTAVHSRRIIAVNDALSDPITSPMREYLIEAQVGALLDAPIYRDGKVIGVVCHEHVGGARTWTDQEACFASAVADMLTILIEQAERAELRATIDAQRHLEAQNQKMQALVNLARVVTHDLSNLLTIASLRTDSLNKADDIDAARQEIAQVLNYGNEQLRHLKEFCDERGPTGQVLARQALKDLQPTIVALLGKDITFTLQMPEVEVTLPLLRLEFEQVIMNLVGNARDAVGQNGRIGVKAWTADHRPQPHSLKPQLHDLKPQPHDLKPQLHDLKPQPHDLKPQPHDLKPQPHDLKPQPHDLKPQPHDHRLHIDITDNGQGMLPITRERLFEPFYSTKSGHTGIGLAAVYGIIQRVKGQIDVRSAPGEGTSFHLIFPIVVGET